MTSPMRSLLGRIAPALVALALLAPAGAAQTPPPSQGDRDRLEQRVRARMAQMIRERLDLTAEEGERLSAVMEGFHERRQELRREEWALRQEVAQLGRGGEGITDDEARQVLDRLVRLREEEVRLFRDEQEALLGVLTPAQLLTFHALRDRMGERIRELRGGRGGFRGPGGPPGFGLQER